MKYKRTLALSIVAMLVLFPLLAIAHSGRTDSSGGHKDNKNKSGLGSYHYHCGGHPAHLHPGGVCPYSSSSKGTESNSQSSTKRSKSVSAPTVRAASVSIAGGSAMPAGGSMVLSSQVYPVNVSKKSVLWSSSNPKVATVSKSGKVTAKKVASKRDVTITCTSADGFAWETHVITVYPAAKSVEILHHNEPTSALIAIVGDAIALTVKTNPAEIASPPVWKSSNRKVAPIDETGYLQPLKPGKATITARVDHKTAKLQVEIIKPDVPHSLHLSCDPKVTLKAGASISVEAEIFPLTATGSILWKSSNSKVVSIGDGRITAIKKGKATITAYVKGSKVKATVAVTVK